MVNQTIEFAALIIFLISTIAVMHALFVVLFRRGRRKAAGIRLAVVLTATPIIMMILFAMSGDLTEVSQERRAEIQAERERKEAERIERERVEAEQAAAAEAAAAVEREREEAERIERERVEAEQAAAAEAAAAVERERKEAERIERERVEAEQAAAAEAACRNDTQCWGDRHNVAASIACTRHVERMARYSAEWTDGFWGIKFPRFRRSTLGNGIMVYIGDAIRFQNGFGAWMNMIYECTYDPATETVLDVNVREGRLP